LYNKSKAPIFGSVFATGLLAPTKDFGVLLIPTAKVATIVFTLAFIAAPPVDLDGIREAVAGSLLYGNNIVTATIIP